jgi:hypothetical protein
MALAHRVGGRLATPRLAKEARCRSHHRQLSTLNGAPHDLVVRRLEWGVPPRHSIAAFLGDNRGYTRFPVRWLGAVARTAASLKVPQPEVSMEFEACAADLAVARDAATRREAAARQALLDARRATDACNGAWLFTLWVLGTVRT